jgi:hypothetical protein
VIKLKRITKIDAYQGLDEIDFKVMEQELSHQYSFASDLKDVSHEFYLEDDGSCIVMKIYHVGEEVALYRFRNKGVVTEENKNAVGRPSLGITKKVSLTLPERVWNEIEERKEENDISQSQAIKDMLEYACQFPKDTVSQQTKEHRFAEFKDFVFGTDLSKIEYHFNKNGLIIISKVEKVEAKYDDAGVKVHFKGGNLTIWKDNYIQKSYRPANLIIECEVCYSLYNEYEDFIGYLYVKKEKGRDL